jgi:uridine kinase
MSDPAELVLSRMPLPRRLLLESVVAELRHNYPRGRVMVAVDGPTAAGKTTFADDLAVAWRAAGSAVFRASVDDFLRPRADRYARGRDSAEGRYLDSYDYSLLRRVLIEPFRMGGSTGFELRAFDREADRPFVATWTTAGPDAVLLVDGSFLNRPELRGAWHAVIWLDAERAERDRRIEARDGFAPGSATAGRYAGAVDLYMASEPRAAASVLVDNTDPAAPVRAFNDYCVL